MKVTELGLGARTTLEISPAAAGDFAVALSPGEEATVQFLDITGEAMFRVGASAWPVEAADRASGVQLARIRDRDLPRVGWIAAVEPRAGTTRVVTLQVHEFLRELGWDQAVEIGVDDKVVEQIASKLRRRLTLTEATAWLEERIVLPAADALPRVFITGLSAADSPMSAFRLLGNGIAADVASDSDGRLLVSRVVAARRGQDDAGNRPVELVRARVAFVDATVVGRLAGAARSELDELVRQADSYLGIWRGYNERERQSVLRRARELGVLPYSQRSQLADGRWLFHIEGSPAEFQLALDTMRGAEDTLELEVADEVPLVLRYNAEPAGAAVEPASTAPRKRRVVGTFDGGDPTRRTLQLRTTVDEGAPLPPARGVIYLSLSGDERRLERRQKALGTVVSADGPMPQLGLLLEGRPVPQRRARRQEPLSPAVRAVFGGPPTPRQVEALRVALNTPDIALIQGPPGTGKTQTIAALHVRLAEMKEDGDPFGESLLTSYQHDAVENAVAKTIVFGLPAIKVGRKRGAIDENDGVDRWRRERAEWVRAELAADPAQPVGEALRRLRQLAAAYVSAPLPLGDSVHVAREVDDVAGEFLSPRLRDRLREIRQDLATTARWVPNADADRREVATRAVRSIRVDEAGYLDDGPANAFRALRRLEPLGLLDDRTHALISKAAAWADDGAPPFLDELAGVKAELLDHLAAAPTHRSPAIHAGLESVLGEIIDELYRKTLESAEGETATLYEYLRDLEDDPEGVRSAVRQYTAVLAATCQQAVGFEMTAVKSDGVVFDNVVVDEAARANPLDLLMPMSRARRRIILVGDHRQLPHILEPDIERELEGPVSEATREALRESLFERLFRDMRAREAVDGIRRTVTLDVQFRMHPDLARFVSDTFYAPYGESFGSERPGSEFAHSLPGYDGLIAAWVNLPLERGREVSGRSKRRQVEAKWIAHEVKRLLVECPALSIGVISFYAAQVTEILRAMEDDGLAESVSSGAYRVAEDWRETRGDDGHLKERLRVGTVDAFQGKEFDAVILSMTRSNDFEAPDQAGQRHKFGHLMLENRLCVAMSRQQRMLIVVGDAEMLVGPAAQEAIPGLVAFRELCEGERGAVLHA